MVPWTGGERQMAYWLDKGRVKMEATKARREEVAK